MPSRAIDASATVASDFSMLLLTGGKERTELEYRALLGDRYIRHAYIVVESPTGPSWNAGRSMIASVLERNCLPRALRDKPGRYIHRARSPRESRYVG